MFIPSPMITELEPADDAGTTRTLCFILAGIFSDIMVSYN